MPSARTTTRAAARAAAKASPPERRSPVSRAFGRFGRPKPAGGKRAADLGKLYRDVVAELKKVEWPTREQALKLTGAVVGLSAVVGLFLGAFDFVFSEFFKFLIQLSGGGV